VGDDVYGGTFRYLEKVRRPNGVTTRYADLAADPEAMWEALSERTRLVWFETPDEPAAQGRRHRGRGGVLRERYGGGPRPLLVVDNTFASPILQRPLDLGADIVFHSRRSTSRAQRHGPRRGGDARRGDRRAAAVPAERDGRRAGPFDCFLALRGLRTLPLRVGRHAPMPPRSRASWRARRHRVAVRTRVLASGPHAHPQAACASRQMRAGGGMVSFVPAARAGRSARERAVRDLRIDPDLHPRRVARRRRIADRAAGR
jgi:cystathionine beta-lyase/cystathionine gamma-synthase